MTEQIIFDGHPAQNTVKEGSISKLDTALEFMWLLIIFLVPLYFNPLEHQAFYFAKSLLLQFLVLILAGVAIGQWFLNVRGNSSVRLTDYVKKSPLQVAVICFGLIWIVSTVFSIMPELSFWGSVSRKNGLITEIYWMVFFFTIACKMRSSAQIFRALYTLIVSAGIVSLLGILQFFNPQILPWFSAGGRIFSTDGNALSLSAFLAMVIPVNLALLILTSYDKSEIRSKKIFKQMWMLTAFILQVACLCLAQYSVTLLLFIVGIFVFFTLTGIFLKKKATLAFGIIALVSIAVIAIILIGQMIGPGKPGSATGVHDSGTPVAEQIGLKTLGARILIWEAAADIILKSPELAFYQDNYHFLRKIIGYGPETYIAMSQTTFPVTLKSSATYRADFLGQPENHYLYLGATVGLLGLISFLAIIIVFAYQSLKLLIKSGKPEVVLVISAFIAAIIQYCAHMLFNPTAIDPELIFWMIMGLTVVFIKLESPASAIAQSGQPSLLIERHIIPEDKSNIARRIIAAIILIIFVCVALGLTIRPLMADMKLQRALDLWPKDKQMALTSLAEAAKIEAFEASYYGYLGYYAYLKATSSTDSDERTRLLEVSVAAYDLADRVEPHIAYWNYMPADVFTYWAKSGVEDKWPRAIYLYESADGLFPENAVIINKLALALMLRGDYAAAKQKLVQSQEADPSWSQTSFYTGLLNIYENGPGSSAEYFISPVRNGINNIGYFMDFCRQISLYKEIVPIAEELKLNAGKRADDWVAQSLWGIASVYANNIPDSQAAFQNLQKIVPAENINLTINIIRQLAYENTNFAAVSGSLLEELKNKH